MVDLTDVKRMTADALRRVGVLPASAPRDAFTQIGYGQWFDAHKATEEELAYQRATTFAYEPVFSIVVPLYETPVDYLYEMAESVLAQSYAYFELLLVNASPANEELAAAVQVLRDCDARVKEIVLDGNYGITENTNYGIDAASGDFVCFLDHDDLIAPNALYEYAKVLNEREDVDILYSDEDLVEQEGKALVHKHPHFKPAYAPELLLCKNYVIHFMAIRRALVQSVERADARFDGSQDYNTLLKCTEQARVIVNVEKVLYHWRISDASTATNPDVKPYNKRAARLGIQDHLRRIGCRGSIVTSGIQNLYTIWFSAPENDPLVSIIVLMDDEGGNGSEEMFLEALSQTNSYAHVEVRFVERKSGLLSALNAAARGAKGEYLLFMSSQDRFVTPDPLQQLMGLCRVPGVGVASAKTIYGDTSVKCFGVAVTPERIMPLYRGYPDDAPAYQCNARTFQNASAAGWQGLMVERALFESVAGFDASYEGEIGTADFCRAVLERGQRIACTPTVKLLTEERPKGERYDDGQNAPDFTQADLRRFDEKWPGARAQGDLYFNANLDQSSEYFQF